VIVVANSSRRGFFKSVSRLFRRVPFYFFGITVYYIDESIFINKV